MTRVAFQGERGAYSEEAALLRFPRSDTVPLRGLADVFRALASGTVDRAVVAIENSQAGSINQTYDLMRRHDLYIIGELIVPVDHCLLALPGETLDTVKRVHSHPSALEQCDAFLVEHKYEAVVHYDTAGSAKMIAEGQLKGEGALASRRAARIYGLDILASSVQTIKENWTRFVVLSPTQEPKGPGPHKTSIMFTTEHRPGALYNAMGQFAKRSINLMKLESRPSRSKAFEYVFYVDFEGHREDMNVREALAGLGDITTFLKVLGSYTKAAGSP